MLYLKLNDNIACIDKQQFDRGTEDCAKFVGKFKIRKKGEILFTNFEQDIFREIPIRIHRILKKHRVLNANCDVLNEFQN